MKKMVVSFLASGRGSNFKVVAEKIIEGYIPGKLGILIVDQENAGALEIARKFGMDAFYLDPRKYDGRISHEKEIITLLGRYKTDLVVAAGYMRVLTPYFVKTFHNRIINIHPALLPSFPGVHAQKQAFDYGVKVSGCTTHFIDEGTDSGPVILQASVPVLHDDTLDVLSSRILKEEHRILPESVKLYCEGKLRVNGRKVIIEK